MGSEETETEPDTSEDTMEQGCCRSPHTRRGCLVSIGLGSVFLLTGLVVLVAGTGMLEKKILQTMALAPGSDRLQSWLVPPVQAHLTGYAFHVPNPEAVQRGEKPVLQEIGPFVYKAVTVKDSVDQDTRKEHLEYNQDGETLTYRPRKFYYLDREQSSGDPDTAFITVPNVPLLTGFRKIKDAGWSKSTMAGVIKMTGLGTPFINVSFSGLLWGYHDELPCLSLARPDGCGQAEGEVDLFAADGEDDWEDDCFKSGVFNMEPCKRTPELPLGAPIALSYPHFYEADQSFLEAVDGLKPIKEEHQFYVDVVPEFGFPLAIRPRFQLNAIIRKDEDIDIMSNFVDELVLPFLWAQDGFSEPSEEIAAAIKFGLTAPSMLPKIGGSALLV